MGVVEGFGRVVECFARWLLEWKWCEGSHVNTPVGLRMENDSRKSCEPPSALETVARIDAQMSRGESRMELALKKVFGKPRGKVGTKKSLWKVTWKSWQNCTDVWGEVAW